MAKIISKTVDELIDDYWAGEIQHSRNVRKELLDAVDKYRVSTLTGALPRREIVTLESPTPLIDIEAWYYDILDLKYDSIFYSRNVPPEILALVSDTYKEHYALDFNGGAEMLPEN